VANNAGCAISHRSDWATCARDTQKLRAQIKILTHNMMDDSEKKCFLSRPSAIDGGIGAIYLLLIFFQPFAAALR